MAERKDKLPVVEDRLSPVKRRRLSTRELNFVGKKAPASFRQLRDRAVGEIKAGATDPNKMGAAYETHVYRPAPGKAFSYEPVFLDADWTERMTLELGRNLAEVFGDRPMSPQGAPVVLGRPALEAVFGPSKSVRMSARDRGLTARSDQTGDDLQRDIDTRGIVAVDDPEAESIIQPVV